jgi:hypothetical protein
MPDARSGVSPRVSFIALGPSGIAGLRAQRSAFRVLAEGERDVDAAHAPAVGCAPPPRSLMPPRPPLSHQRGRPARGCDAAQIVGNSSERRRWPSRNRGCLALRRAQLRPPRGRREIPPGSSWRCLQTRSQPANVGWCFHAKRAARCSTEAAARSLTPASRGSACASSGPCRRPAVCGPTVECVAFR